MRVEGDARVGGGEALHGLEEDRPAGGEAFDAGQPGVQADAVEAVEEALREAGLPGQVQVAFAQQVDGELAAAEGGQQLLGDDLRDLAGGDGLGEGDGQGDGPVEHGGAVGGRAESPPGAATEAGA